MPVIKFTLPRNESVSIHLNRLPFISKISGSDTRGAGRIIRAGDACQTQFKSCIIAKCKEIF